MMLVALWLCLLGPGLGALPLVLAADATGWRGGFVDGLRRLLLLALAAPLGLLLLLRGQALFGPGGGWGGGGWGGGGWGGAVAVGLRAALLLAGLVALALAARRRRAAGFAWAGMAAFAVLAGLLLMDWVVGVAGALHAASMPALVIAGWMSLAAGLACVLEAGWRDGTVPRGGGVVLAVLMGLWVFMAFTQFLVAWSADLPEEAGWYLARLHGVRGGAVLVGAVASVAVLLVLPARIGQRRRWRSACGLAVAGLQLGALLWLAAGGAHGR